jgi:hypothetical protein
VINDTLELYFKDMMLGKIICTGGDFPWNHGVFIPNSEAENFREFFEYIISGCEDANPPFPGDLFNESLWFVLFTDKGLKWGIHIPNIYPDNKIGWKWS